MMVHKVIDRINNLMANGVSVDDEFYRALWGRSPFFPNDPIESSSDYECGAIANELEYALATGTTVTRPSVVGDLPDTFIEIFLQFFVGYTTSSSDTVEDLLNRMYSIVLRNESRTLMTRWGLWEAVSYFLSDTSGLYIDENKITGPNLIVNPIFEDPLSSWTTTESGGTTVNRSLDYPFQEAHSIDFSVDSSQSVGTLEQTVTGMSARTHFLSFFLYDDGVADGASVASVEVTRSSDGYYYNFDTMSWQSSSVDKPMEVDTRDRFTLVKLPILYEDTSDATVRIRNSGASTVAHKFYVDRFELGVKENPHIEILLVSQGTKGDYIQTWENGEDPVGYSSGTADTDSDSKLIDSSATFETDGVVADDIVWNTTDNVSGVVVSVDSETELALDHDAFPDGNEDYTITNTDYQNQAGFLDSSYLGGYIGGGTTSVAGILHAIKPSGVQVTWKTITRAV